MYARQLKQGNNRKTDGSQPFFEHQRETSRELNPYFSPHTPLGQVRSRNATAAVVHAQTMCVNQDAAAHPTRSSQALLHLQRHYGNHYVQRLIAQAQQEEAATEASAAVEQRIHQARGGGQALDRGVRVQMESAFGADFSGVRIHTGGEADALNRDLSARAFATGQDIFFRQDEYSPGSAGGRELLAHELTHVVQQTGHLQFKLAVGAANDVYEQEADQTAAQVMRLLDGGPGVQRQCACGGTLSADGECEACRRRALPIQQHALDGPETKSLLQRKIEVSTPTGTPAGAPAGVTNETIVRDYVTTLCPDFTVTGKDVLPVSSGFCATDLTKSSAPEACACFCEVHALRDLWTIVVDDHDWPHTDDATKTVTVHSPFSGVQFGAWAAGPPAHRMIEHNWLVLGHELCGHARLLAAGTHPTGPAPTHGGRPSHDVTVQIENRIASEHGIPSSDLRGLFADPHHGESFARVTVAEFPNGSADMAALPAAESHKLDIAEAFIRSAPVKMDIIGHSDQTGTAAVNASLSQQRANRVRAALRGRGIAAGRFLATQGVGAAECAAPGDQPACRKVEIFMFIMEGASVTHP